MGSFDIFSGAGRSAPDSAALSEQEVRTRLLALNRPTAPWHIVDGSAEQIDFIAEWKIVDALWRSVFEGAGITRVFRIYLKLDATMHVVRAVDREYSVEWSAGVPCLQVVASAFRGQSPTGQLRPGYAFTEQAEPGKVFQYRFSTSEIKKPILDAVAGCGWAYRGVATGKL